MTVPIGGVDQTMLIRGVSTDAPVLLFLAGGPGGTEIGAIREDVGLEHDFVVATWDQRGTGKSYAAIDPIGAPSDGRPDRLAFFQVAVPPLRRRWAGDPHEPGHLGDVMAGFDPSTHPEPTLRGERGVGVHDEPPLVV